MALEFGEVFSDLTVTGLELARNLFVHVLQQALARIEHLLVDLFLQFGLKLVEGGINLGFVAGTLNNLKNAPLDIDASLDNTEHFIAGAEDAFEQIELLAEKLINAL